jgi:glutamate-1-semialdehyde aminotransferase
MSKGHDLYQKAKKLIPTGTQLLSKRPERFLLEGWPSYFDHIKGVEVTDLDGNTYTDMSINCVGSYILGAADPDVDSAVQEAITKGTMSTLNCPEEVELAELLTELHPWADMARYARSGGEALAIAVRIARAHTGRDHVAFCGYHGWHDWYIAAQLASPDALSGHLRAGLDPAGVPKALKGTVSSFHYNKIEELEEIIKRDGKNIGTIVMEPIRNFEPEDNFLQKVRIIADDLGAVLIFDEVSAGFRLTTGGAHLLYDVNPDMAVFAKGMGNGYPIAAIIGTEDVMSSAGKSFISSTNWTERIGPVAAIAVIKKHRKKKVHEHLIRMGTQVQEGWKKAASQCGLPIEVDGMKPMSHFSIETENPQPAYTLFTQEMLGRGFLASNQFYATYAHTEGHISSYLEAVQEVFPIISDALKKGDIEERISGGVAIAGFKKMT